MIINVIPEKCTGCRACEAFCSLEQEGIVNPDISRVQVLKEIPHNIFVPILCPPCQDKPCMAVCPEPGAMVIDPASGAVVIIEELCTACSKCIAACEIGAIQFLRRTGRGKMGKAVAIKCDQCGGDPWCVRVCEPAALEYIEQSVDLEGQAVYERLRTVLVDSEEVMGDRGARRWRRKVRV